MALVVHHCWSTQSTTIDRQLFRVILAENGRKMELGAVFVGAAHVGAVRAGLLNVSLSVHPVNYCRLVVVLSQFG